MMKNNVLKYLSILTIFTLTIGFFSSCKDNEDSLPPTIEIQFSTDNTADGDTLEVGNPIRVTISAKGIDANITNFLIEKVSEDTRKTVVDSGLNSSGFEVTEVFYQGVEDNVDWTFTVMDRNRNSESVSLNIIKDPNSQFGGILEFDNIILGYQNNTEIGNFFLPQINEVYFEDSATIYKDLVDVLCYFFYSEDNGVNKPSPTFSSPGEDANCSGYLYEEHYPFISNWDIRNYTKYDIRVTNGITDELYNNMHNDSLLIVSYDDVWGKKKYKWVTSDLFIPFQTANGNKGIIHVIEADNTEDGEIIFSMKIQQ
jgi:hypothetical protein